MKICVCLMLVILMLTGGIAMGADLVQPEEIYAAFSLTEQDIAPERLERVIGKYGIDPEMMKSLTKDDILNAANYYGYLLADQGEAAYPGDRIHCVAAYRTMEIACESILIDFDTRTVYYDPGLRFFDDVRKAGYKVTFDPGEWDMLEKTFQVPAIGEEKNQVGRISLGVSETLLAIESDSGVYVYTVTGVTEQSTVKLHVQRLLSFAPFIKSMMK